MNLLIALYFLCPKIDLIIFEGGVTGIRLQDYIALILLCKIYGDSNLLNLRFISLIYIILNILLSYFNDSFNITLLAWLRIFEYYVIGYAIYKYLDIKYFKLIIYVEIIFISLQYFLIIPNFDPGRGIFLSNQYSGTFGTPAEFSYFVGLLSFYYLTKLSLVSIFTLIPIIVSNGVQSSVLISLANLINKIELGNKIKILFIVLCSVTFMSIYSKDVFDVINFFKVISIYDFTTFDISYFKEKYSFLYDPLLPQTLNMRLSKWGVAIHLILTSNIVQLLFGNGLYVVGGALDSGIIRFIYELGLMPLFYFCYKLYKKNINALVVIFFANIFFDAWISSVTGPIIIAIYLKSLHE